jgi:hypothetical protein
MDIISFIKQYWECVAEQDCIELRKFFSEYACIRWHNTNEQFNTYEFIRANCEYPGTWTGVVERIEQNKNTVISVTRISSEELSFHVISFFTIKGGRIETLDEYWSDDGAAPQWRTDMHIGRKITESKHEL